MAEFELAIDRWVRAARDKIDRAPQAIVYALLGRLQELTPVVTGTLRAAWHVVQSSETEWQIVNNVEYAKRVNFGFVGNDSLGRYYNQLGAHMVEQTLAEAPAIARQAVKDLR